MFQASFFVMFVEIYYASDAANISGDTGGSDFTEYLAKHGMFYSLLLLVSRVVIGRTLFMLPVKERKG